MIGIILVTHGGLAEEFVAATEHVVGPQPNMHAISIGPDDDIEQRRRDILAAVDAVADGAGVILLTDMFGGTPPHLTISIMNQGKVEIIAHHDREVRAVVLSGAGETQPAAEKSVSYVRTEFRATAETRNRPPDFAEAMVDADVEIPDLIEKGKQDARKVLDVQ